MTTTEELAAPPPAPGQCWQQKGIHPDRLIVEAVLELSCGPVVVYRFVGHPEPLLGVQPIVEFLRRKEICRDDLTAYQAWRAALGAHG